jgi:hypothetical protein
MNHTMPDRCDSLAGQQFDTGLENLTRRGGVPKTFGRPAPFQHCLARPVVHLQGGRQANALDLAA